LAGISIIIFLDYSFGRCTCAEGTLHGNFNVICVMVPVVTMYTEKNALAKINVNACTVVSRFNISL